jgi:hypothetical protein
LIFKTFLYDRRKLNLNIVKQISQKSFICSARRFMSEWKEEERLYISQLNVISRFLFIAESSGVDERHRGQTVDSG